MADIKQRIVLEGEKEYNAAIKDAQRNLKTLRSELKAETAELGKNATAQQKAEVRTKSLQKQIAEQEKIVKANRDALEEVREKYGDNAEVVAKWEQKLNESRAALANMKNSLDSVGESFAKVDASAQMGIVATKSFADSLSNLASIGDSISSSIEGVFTSTIDVVRETIGAVWEEIVGLAARSNNIVDLAGFWNTDATTIQKYAGAVAHISGSLEDLNGIVTKINSKDSKSIAELVGVSGENYEDQWEYAMAVMDAMSKMDIKKRNEVGFELFGKGATKAFDILNDWATLQENLDKQDSTKGGYGLTEEELNTMSDLYDKVNGLKNDWQALKDMATVKLFGSLSMDLTGNAQAILDGFLKYFNAKDDAEREKALAEVETNITEAFKRVSDAIEQGIAMIGEIAKRMQSSEDPTVQALGNILDALVKALQWLTEDNMRNVVTALEILAAFWLVGKGASMAATIAQMVANIAVIKGFSGPSTPVTTPTSTPTTTGQPKTVTDSSGFWGLLGAAAIYSGFEWAANRRRNTPELVRGTDENLETFVQDDGLRTAFIEYVASNKALQEMYDSFDIDPEKEAELLQQVNAAREALNALEGSGELLAAYSDWRQEHSYGNMDWQLPDASWWQTNNSSGLTSDDISGFRSVPNLMAGAVQRGVSGIRVTMDGSAVGRLVAPYVSQYIAAETV